MTILTFFKSNFILFRNHLNQPTFIPQTPLCAFSKTATVLFVGVKWEVYQTINRMGVLITGFDLVLLFKTFKTQVMKAASICSTWPSVREVRKSAHRKDFNYVCLVSSNFIRSKVAKWTFTVLIFYSLGRYFCSFKFKLSHSKSSF